MYKAFLQKYIYSILFYLNFFHIYMEYIIRKKERDKSFYHFYRSYMTFLLYHYHIGENRIQVVKLLFLPISSIHEFISHWNICSSEIKNIMKPKVL